MEKGHSREGDFTANLVATVLDGLHKGRLDFFGGGNWLATRYALNAICLSNLLESFTQESYCELCPRNLLLPSVNAHIVNVRMRIRDLLDRRLRHITHLLDCQRHHWRISVKYVGENTQLLGEVDERRAAETDNLAAAGGQEETVEEVAASVVRLLAAQGRLPILHCHGFARHFALLAREVLEVGVNLALHQAD